MPVYDAGADPHGEFAPARPSRALLAVFTVGLIAFTAIVVGVVRLPDRHTSTATMKVTDSACVDTSDTFNGFRCVVGVRYMAWGKLYAAAGIGVDSPVRLSAGDSLELRFDPEDPTDVVQDARPRPEGVAFISVGAIILALNTVMAVRKCAKATAAASLLC